jgi:hypothetical protein
MWIIKMVLQAFVLFAVPVVILTLYIARTDLNHSKATGIEAFQVYGPFLVVTGLFYVAFGVFLWSPLPKQLLLHLVSRHLNG